MFAIVGKNGAGKTTLVKFLTGLYKPTEGSVRIGETDLNIMTCISTTLVALGGVYSIARHNRNVFEFSVSFSVFELITGFLVSITFSAVIGFANVLYIVRNEPIKTMVEY